MPIDFARIADIYRQQMKERAKSMSEALIRIGEWVNQRLTAARDQEAATRMFPVIWFYNGAVTMWIDRSQHGQLTPGAPSFSLGESLREGGARFIRGIVRVKDAWTEELALPRLLGTFADILSTIAGAMDRFPAPTPAMFDIRTPRTASDLFGQAGLLFRAFTSSMDQVRSFADQGHQAYASLGQSNQESNLDWPALLQDAVRWLVGAILLIPIASELIGATLREAILAAKFYLIHQLQEIEAEVYSLRREVIDFFYTDLAGFGPKAFDFLLAAQIVFIFNLEFYFRFAEIYMRQLFDGLRTFARQLTEFLNVLVDKISGVLQLIEDIANIDLLPMVMRALGIPPYALRLLPDMPRITLGDLVGVNIQALRLGLNMFLTQLANHPVVRGLGLFTSVRRRIQAAREFLNILMTPRNFIAETMLPAPFARFPDLFATFFGSGATELIESLRGAATGLQTEIGNVFNAGQEFLLATSRAAMAEANRAASVGSLAEYAESLRLGGETASAVFGPEIAGLRQRIAAGNAFTRLAGGFERAVADGGFEIIGAVIPGYVEQMSHYWRDRSESEVRAPSPTSPHILNRRAGLRRVRMPRLAIVTAGFAMDSGLVERIAQRFKSAIEEAFVTGLAQVERAS